MPTSDPVSSPARCDIAVVAAAALYPASVGVEEFWTNIVSGGDFLSDVPPTHWLPEDYYDPDPKKPGKIYTRRGAFLPPVDFDPIEFGVPPNILSQTDTSQLLSLVVAKRLLAATRSLQAQKVDRARVSVILGVGSTMELVGQMAGKIQRPIWENALRASGLPERKVAEVCDRIFASYPDWTEATFPGLLTNVVAGRIANRFDLGGANFAVDAACASSLASVSLAVQELQLGRSDLVVTGGVDTLNEPVMFMCFSKTPALSPTGDCRPFSDRADGTMLGEGLGLVALRRLADAERDGDRVLAVIRGIGSSSDGRAKSVYAPRPAGQALALRRAYEQAGFGPSEVGLVEAHGTGTVAGDAAEMDGLCDVFGPARPGEKQWCALGSVKSQFGHTKSAAGVAGLLKIVLALQHRILPPTAKVDRPNPAMKIDEGPFYLNTVARPWIHPAGTTRKAAVSSFGFGGSNFHLAVEEYAGAGERARVRRWPLELVLFSADDFAGLEAAAKLFEVEPAARPLAVSARATQRAFRAGAALRLAVLAPSRAEAATRLRAALANIRAQPTHAAAQRGEWHFGLGAPAGKLAFLFSGQGSHYVGMGGALAMEFDSARAVWDRAAAPAEANCPRLDGVVFPPPAFSDADRATQSAALTQTENAQPALGLVALSQLALLRELGVRPDAVAGHSYGELVALHAAGAIGDETALLRLSRRRGELMAAAARATTGAMTAVGAPAEKVRELLAAANCPATLANLNSPRQTVIAGRTAEIEPAEAALKAGGVSFTRLPVATAFHSPVVAPSAAPWAEFLAGCSITAPQIPVYANATAAPYPAAPDGVRAQLAAQLAAPVRFSEQIAAMHADGVRLFIEVGAGNVLTRLVGDILAGREHHALALDERKRDGVAVFAEALAALAGAGRALDFAALWRDCAEALPEPAAPSAATVKLSGANYGKPYPPKNGAAGRARPNPELPDPPKKSPPVTSTAEKSASRAPFVASPAEANGRHAHPAGDHANGHAVPAPAPADEWLAAFQSLQHTLLAAQEKYQSAMTESHVAFLRLSETAMRQLSGEGAPSPASPPAKTGHTNGSAAPCTAPFAEPRPESNGHAPRRLAAPEPRVAPTTPSAVPSAPPAPAAAVSVAAAPVATAADTDYQGLLVSVVSEATGYPVEMLTPELELEAGLGIDSIKRVEIFSALTAKLPFLAQFDATQLAKLNTLGEIAAFAREHGPAVTEPHTEKTAQPKPPPAPRPSAPTAPTDPQALLFKVVAEATGYPVEMLNPDMELESGLGIDSIKRVEIFSALTAKLPFLAQFDATQLAKLSTLGQIIAFAREHAPGAVPAPAPIAAEKPPASAEPPLERRETVRTEQAAPGFKMPGLRDAAPAFLLSDTRGVAHILAARLRAAGISAELAPGPPPGARAIIDLRGLDANDRGAHALNHAAFATARTIAAGFTARGGVFVSVLDSAAHPAAAGARALVRTAAREWPQATLKAIDLAVADRAADAVAAQLFEELIGGGDDGVVHLAADGARRIEALRPNDRPAPAAASALKPGSCVVATGGARGVTAHCLIALARAVPGLKFALLARTPLGDDPAWAADRRDALALKCAALDAAKAAARSCTPAQIDAEVRGILAAREARANLAALQAAGAEARYFVCDATDGAAIARAVAEVRAAFGPVAALVHGAGVLADKLIAAKTDEQFARVFRPKVEGLAHLLAATAGDPLTHLCAFTSIAAVAGNAGQVDYAMANEVLAEMLRAERARRGAVCTAKAFAWGPWDGGMVQAPLKAHFAARGLELIPLAAGAEFFARELMTPPSDAVEIVVGAGLDRWMAPAAPAPARRREIWVHASRQPSLDSHRVQGTAVVPLALAATWLARAAGVERGTLRDLKVLHGVRLPDFSGSGHWLTVETTPQPDGSVACRLLGAEGRAHYSALALPRAEMTASAGSAENFPAWETPLATVYATLFHGPAFRCITQLTGKSAAGCTGIVSLAAPEVWRDPAALLDGALQFAVLWNREHDDRDSLPTGFRRFTRHAALPLDRPVRCTLTVLRHDAQHSAWDVRLVDEHDRVLAEFHEVTFHKLASRTAKPARAGELVSG